MPANHKELRLRAKRRADMENSAFVSDPEWADYLSEGLSELHDIVTGKNADHIVKSESITLVSGQDSYDLPEDFYRVRGVDVVSGGSTYTIEPFMFRERNRLQFSAGFTHQDIAFMYQVVGDKLRIIPDPSGSGTLTLWYIPEAGILKTDTDRIDVAYPNGWERYVVLYAAIKALQKKRADVSALQPELLMLHKRIETAATRTSGDPKRVVDVRYRSETWRG